MLVAHNVELDQHLVVAKEKKMQFVVMLLEEKCHSTKFFNTKHETRVRQSQPELLSSDRKHTIATYIFMFS